jgi:hypothetical protein
MPHESDLALAIQHVARAKLFVANQHARIARLRDAGCSTLDAEHTLEVFISTLGVFEDHERQLREEFASRRRGGRRPQPLC